MQKKYLSSSPDDTRKIAREIIAEHLGKAALLGKPLIIMLYGDLGAGKTVFVKEIGRELGVEDIVSPAFVVYYEYPLNHETLKYLYHFDLYRVTDEREFEHLGIADILKPEHILAIEWSEHSESISELLHERGYIVRVSVQHNGDNNRVIEVNTPEI